MKGGSSELAQTASVGLPEPWSVSDWVPIDIFSRPIIPSLQEDQPQQLWTSQIKVMAFGVKLARNP